jgi:hypothetical protein
MRISLQVCSINVKKIKILLAYNFYEIHTSYRVSQSGNDEIWSSVKLNSVCLCYVFASLCKITS